MMRALVALLLAANLAYFGYTQGWLDTLLGAPSRPQREPQRLAQQVQPQSVAVLSPAAASAAIAAAQAAAKAAASCLEAGPFTNEELAKAEAALAEVTLPDGTVGKVERVQSAVWMVYMGRFADRESMLRKAEELKRLRMVFEELNAGQAALVPGISLGRFDTRQAADAALTQLSQQGLRTAKVVAFSEASTRWWLRSPQADPDLAARLQALKVAALGAGFQACVK